MKKKSKILLSIGLVIVTVFAFALVSFAEIASSFVEDQTYGYMYNHPGYSSTSLDISDIPSSALYLAYKSWNDTDTYTLTFVNDTQRSFTFTFQFLIYERNNYNPRIMDLSMYNYHVNNGMVFTASVNGNASLCYADSTVSVNAGGSVVFSATPTIPGGGSAYAMIPVLYVSNISPDPQHIPGPIEVILNTVSGFFSSMLSAWTNLISMITSSWVFLVPLVMMVTVFMVVFIRKVVKGV